jgi:hypothetical protein
MAVIKISGVPGLDGDYPIDFNALTNRNLHQIKKIAGVRAGEIVEAFQAGDNDLVVVLAVIAVQNSGKFPQLSEAAIAEMLWDAPAGSSITIDLSDEEDDASPPAILPNEPNSPSGSSGAPATSGSSSSEPGDLPVSPPSLTGLPGSGTGATSDPETLAS